MTKMILVGKGRRITLAELYGISFSAGGLEWQASDGDLPAADGVDSLLAALASEASDDTPSTIAALVLLTMKLAQDSKNLNTVSMLMEAINVAKSKATQLSWDPSKSEALPTMTQDTYDFATLALYAYRASRLAVAAALPISALSVERLQSPIGDAFAESSIDVARPHRGIIQAASIMRTLVHSSKVTEKSDKDPPPSCILNIPHYHGPSQQALTDACKTLELEVNCISHDWTDVTPRTMALFQCWEAVTVLSSATSQRCGNESQESTATVTTPSASAFHALVIKWQNLLETEVKLGIEFCDAATEKAAAEAKEKEASKQARQAQDQGPEQKKDEFEGMTEAQKAKILKKRAEKEAKAAAKRKAKEAKQANVFGVGILPVLAILKPLPIDWADALPKLQACTEKLTSGGQQRKPKLPKGTRDYLPDQMKIRQQAFSIIRRVFESHGAVEIDTPVFELKDTLTGKYGEDSKLIYDLADQGGELLALRYDLTVPFARFLALNSVGNIKRFHIGKVYRRDQPALSKGRYREFYQCDFDIAGVYGRMVPDSECLAVACDILDALPIGDFGIKLNHRRLLDAILDLCGVPAEKFRTICSAVDKLDKEPWEAVKKEMVEEKGLKDEVADKIGEFVLNRGEPRELYKQLMDAKRFGDHEGAASAMEDLRILFDYLDAMGKLKFISFDLSLARGLDYYTGVIYEAVCMSGNTQVGSIGGGGRYDNLVSMFQDTDTLTPCVGVSVGIERVFTLMEARLREEQGGSIKQPNVNVLVASVGDGMIMERMKITRLLWDAKISAEFSQKENPKLKFELKDALDRGIPFMVIVGEEELRENKCKVKDINAKTEELVPVSDLVSVLRKKGVIPVGCEFAAELLASEESTSS